MTEYSIEKTLSERPHGKHENVSRRDFITLTASSVAAVGAASFVWPLIDSMNPAADVLALSTTEVDLSPIKKGQTIKVMWRGKPVFIRHRTEKDIYDSENTDLSTLPDPEPDSARVKPGKAEWIIMVAVCTHLGCIPLDQAGEYNGWFCPCHGSHYDTAGRIRKGPAPKNLLVPEYQFVSDTKIVIG